jgi:hypothetical protein
MLSVIAGIFIIEYFVPAGTVFSDITSELSLWGSTITSLVLIYGYTALALMLMRRLQARKTVKYTINAAVTLGWAAIFLIFGLALPGGTSGDTYQLLYLYLVAYAGGGQNASWIHHPYNAYRYFRFTSIEATTMFLSFLALVCRELSALVAIFPPFYQIGSWVESVPNAAVQRVVLMTSAVGACILAVRALVGKEPGLIEAEAL